MASFLEVFCERSLQGTDDVPMLPVQQEIRLLRKKRPYRE
jgi:hypothetical protein